MQTQAGEHPFEKGFQVDKPRKFTWEFGCAGILYFSIFLHFILCIVIFASKNSAPYTITKSSAGVFDYKCPDGMIDRKSCTSSFSTPDCMSKSLCEDLTKCLVDNPSSRRLDDDPRRLGDRQVAKDVWEFLESHAYMPTVLFVGAFAVAAVWLVILQKFPKTVVWSTIAADFAALFFIFLWMLIEAETLNIGILVIMAVMAIGCAVLFKKINHAAVMMKFALNGLFANPHIFGVCFGVQIVWVGFFALWIASLIEGHFVKSAGLVSVESSQYNANTGNSDVVTIKQCQVSSGWPTEPLVIFYWALHYYWVTYFLRNVNVMVITGNLSAWYFEEPDFERNWVKVLAWAFGPLAGGNAMCSFFQGLLEYLMSKVGSTWSLIFGCLNPLEWILICIGLCLKTLAQTYTKFGLIAHCYSARPFCEGAPRTFKLMTKWLGEAIVCDYLGKTVMKWITYVIAVAVGFTAWAWADAAQDISTFSILGKDMAVFIAVLIGYCWILSQPFFSLVLVILIEKVLPDDMSSWGGDGEARAICNALFASIFMGCTTYFIMSFVSQVVVTSMDVCLFCYAVASDHGIVGEDAEKQAFYESIKETITQGQIQSGAAIGQPVSPAAQATGDSAAPPTTVVGNPV